MMTVKETDMKDVIRWGSWWSHCEGGWRKRNNYTAIM